MLDLKNWLQLQLNSSSHDFCQQLVISVSQLPEYDYQSTITKLVISGKQSDLEQLLSSNYELNNMFTYEFTNTNTMHFLSFKLKKDFVFKILETFYNASAKTNCQSSSNFEFIEKTKHPKKVLFDYSSPNMAKDMHVGHLRSTIIGDVLANTFEHVGHNVSRVNHLGDFGLPFGMIVHYVISNNMEITNQTSLQNIYIKAKECFENDNDFKTNSYIRTSQLQSKSDPLVSTTWQQIYEKSLTSYSEIYNILNISQKLEIFGESYYEKYIEKVKTELCLKGLVSTDENNRIIVKTITLNPMIYEKSEEKAKGYTYDTTDITTLWYRSMMLDQDEIYYVVDNGQSYHFKQLFEVGKQMGWITDTTSKMDKIKHAQHIQFGVVTLEKKRIQSRAGNTPKLIDLINKGIEYTKKSFQDKGTEIVNNTVKSLAIGSIKYFDLAKCRTSDYQFDFNRMLRPDGNTYTYLVYSIARCRGVIDNFNINNCVLPEFLDSSKFEEIDYKLLRKICEYPSVVNDVVLTNMPHLFCDYAYKLSGYFHENYTKTRCINFDSENKVINFNESRIVCYLMVMDILKQLFEILGLPYVDKL